MSFEQNQARQWLGINWQLAPNSGWGVLGFNLAIQAERDGRMAAVPMVESIYTESFPSQYRSQLEPIFKREKTALQILATQERSGSRFVCDFPVLHSLGNWFNWEGMTAETERIAGKINLAIIFLEESKLSQKAIDSSRKFNRILAGSTWNKQILKEQGIAHTEAFLQGVDLSQFQPRRKPRGASKPFLIFSGGKLEYRKGQDIVVAAFREFRKKYPNSILVVAWHNPWPQSIPGIERRGYVSGCPCADAQGRLDLAGWFESNGLPRSAVHDVGPVPNHLMPQVYAQVDVGLFPNRCEGGTNLVAMECLASGVPAILSANTGHWDLVDEKHCYPLLQQSPVAPVHPYAHTEGWGETSVDEAVARLEQVYLDRAQALGRADRAVQFMSDWSWEKRYEELLAHLRDCGWAI